ncbi:hypothetical protein ACFYVR_12845 [Rhodococcus sp. NPDC003318]|uniref:hypothetical protein n=1 Tax=Rhodococcus sp. NPDC003318 TaxID=3364503 RepID=UPI0036BCBCB0
MNTIDAASPADVAVMSGNAAHVDAGRQPRPPVRGAGFSTDEIKARIEAMFADRPRR